MMRLAMHRTAAIPEFRGHVAKYIACRFLGWQHERLEECVREIAVALQEARRRR